MEEEKHNPGSDAATTAGCKCPVLDNAHGRGYMGVPGRWIISFECEYHPAGDWPLTSETLQEAA